MPVIDMDDNGMVGNEVGANGMAGMLLVTRM
jgi:hypothetical protein